MGKNWRQNFFFATGLIDSKETGLQKSAIFNSAKFYKRAADIQHNTIYHRHTSWHSKPRIIPKSRISLRQSPAASA